VLVRAGWRVSVNTVAKIMAELGLAGRKIRRRRSLTRQGKRPAAPDWVRRDFTAEAPDLVWVGDMTEIETDEGKVFLATVIDLFSRRLLGYAMGERPSRTSTAWSTVASRTSGQFPDRKSKKSTARSYPATGHPNVTRRLSAGHQSISDGSSRHAVVLPGHQTVAGSSREVYRSVPPVR
jgi:hypothetical protein